MSTISEYTINNVARLSCAFTEADGVTPADPTTITVEVVTPEDDAVQEFSPTKDSTGSYHYDLTLAFAGMYYYRFRGVGAVVAQTPDGQIHVPAPKF